MPLPAAESPLAGEPVRDFLFIGLFNGAPNLARSSEEILCGGVRQALILILTPGAGVDAQRHGARAVGT
jgi:hypothetical protein